MPVIPDLISIADLCHDAWAMLMRVQTSPEPFVITHRGRAAAILLSIDAYEQGEHERRLLRALLGAELEVAAGVGHELDGVLTDADAMLADEGM